MIVRLLFLGLLVFMSGYSQGNETIPLFGFDKFAIGKTSLKEVVEIYPTSKIRKYWEKRTFPELFGWYVKVVDIAESGIRIDMRKDRRFGKYLIDVIYMSEEFKGKTEDGIGIGSNYQQIIKSFGPKPIKGYDSKRSSVTYYNTGVDPRIKGMLYVAFCCTNHNADENTFRVDYIVIS